MLRLRELRIIKGLKQTELAADLKVGRSTIAMWETNRSAPDVKMLRTIADYFNVSIDYLIGSDDKTNPSKETKKVPKDLRKLLEDEEIALNGRMMSEEDKEKMLKILEAAFWEAKEANKRKG